MKIGIFLPSWIGDTAMSTPMLRALRTHFGPSAELTGIGRPHLAELLAGTNWLDDWVLYHPHEHDPQLNSWSVIRQLRPRQLDYAILASNSLRAAIAAWLSGARQRIGYKRYFRGPFLTQGLAPPQVEGRRIPCRMVDYYLQLAYAVGCPSESPQVELHTRPDDEATADELWQEQGLRPGENVIVFHGGCSQGTSKRWPAESFTHLARRIAQELDHDVLINFGPGERELAAEMAERAGHPRVFTLARNSVIPLGVSKAVIRRCRLMVTTDSGPRQFAIAFGVPLVTLAGPYHATWGENPFARELVLQVPLACRPCQKRTCPLGHHKCMRDLSVEQVFRGVVRQLAATRPALVA